MPAITPEIIGTVITSILSISLEFVLIIQNTRRYFRGDYSRSLLIFIISIGLMLISNSLNLISLFLTQLNRLSFVTIKQLSFLFYMISMYALLLFFEVFEHETSFTQLQMVGTILITVSAIILLSGSPETVWSNSSNQILLIEWDPLSSLVIFLFPIIVGVLILSTLRKGLRDVWITQRTQLIQMMIMTVLISVIPFVLTFLILFYTVPITVLADSIIRFPITLGLIGITISFGSSAEFSRFNRQKADKLLVTNLNGIPLFVHDFKENVHYINETLFSGAVVAITMLMSESIRSSSPIAEVLMKNKYRLLLETKDSFIALLLTPRGNRFLRDSLEMFASSFDEKFTSIINSGDILDLNLFVKSGTEVLFENFGISTKYMERMLAGLTFEETLT